MLDFKKIEERIISIEAAAEVMLQEAGSLRAIIEMPKKPAKKDMDYINFMKRKMRSLKKVS